MQSNWQSFLQQQSANINDGLVTDFGDLLTERSQALDGNIITDLSRLDVLEISGKDAGAFLHGQFCSDVSALAVNELQPGAWCNIKGRVIASFLLYRSHDGYYLLLERELTEFVVKRLQMFVLRSELSIKNRSDELVRIGIRGESVHNALQTCIENAAGGSIIVLPVQDAVPRSIILTSLQQATVLWQQVTEDALPVGHCHWTLYDIQAGLAWVGKAGSEEFLPQSLNLDLIDGLSFSKGCYPGQEIVARMHFRGKLKQRLFLASAAVNESPGPTSKLYSPGVNQHVGMVVNAAMQMDDTCLLLVALDLEHANKAAIHLGTEDGPVLSLIPLPYTVDS
jgi:tRNA-modifying protein YgfZ